MAIMLNMSLGGKGFFSINPLKTCCYYNPAAPATNRGSSFKLSTRKINSVSCCSDSFPPMSHPTGTGFNKDNKEIMKQSYKKGDVINLPDLLFTKNRDYLVKNNNELVTAKQLAGKVTLIFFVPISGYNIQLERFTKLLTEVYSECKPNNNFEVVSVPVGVDPSLNGDVSLPIPFLGYLLKSCVDSFSHMPWPSIPISDIKSRMSLQRSFGVSKDDSPATFIIDPTGRVLQTHWYILKIYGALGYPFSDERIKFLKAEDEAITKQPSLKALLASPQRDYLILNNGEKVPIQILEDKVVVLFFYEEGRVAGEVLKELMIAYKRFAIVKHKFEVVLLYQSNTENTFLYANEKTFWKRFSFMPWLALPYNDLNHKRLRRIFEQSYLNDTSNPLQIVIFGPRGEFIEPFGTEILCTYGIEAFPFTRMEAAKLETEKVKELQLGMLWDQNTVFKRKDGSQVSFSQLSGKQVMLFYERAHDFDYSDGSMNIEFLTMLKEKYLHMKGTDDEFEVIHVVESSDCEYIDEYIRCKPYRYAGGKTESLASKHIGDLPWLVSLESKLLPADFGSYLCFKDEEHSNYSVIFAFDRDGKLVRKTIYPTYEDARFPFYAGDLEEEALTQLTTYFSWDYSDNVREKWRILSYKDFRTEGGQREQDLKENVDPKHGDTNLSI